MNRMSLMFCSVKKLIEGRKLLLKMIASSCPFLDVMVRQYVVLESMYKPNDNGNFIRRNREKNHFFAN